MFLVGLFSLLDSISGMPMSDLVNSVALAPAVQEALVARTGPYASALRLTEAYEQGAWGEVARDATSSGLDAAQVSALYVQSLAWTRARMLSVAGA
jgi:EAL and modified HD-GYP domain-containing signal transduction protein